MKKQRDKWITYQQLNTIRKKHFRPSMQRLETRLEHFYGTQATRARALQHPQITVKVSPLCEHVWTFI